MSDDLLQVIARRLAQLRIASEADIVAAAEEGIADMEAGRFVLIDGPDDMRRLRAELAEMLAKPPGRRR